MVAYTRIERRTKKKQTGPKRAITAYMYFCKEKRPNIKNVSSLSLSHSLSLFFFFNVTKKKQENPEMSFSELGSEVGKQWRALTEVFFYCCCYCYLI